MNTYKKEPKWKLSQIGSKIFLLNFLRMRINIGIKGLTPHPYLNRLNIPPKILLMEPPMNIEPVIKIKIIISTAFKTASASIPSHTFEIPIKVTKNSPIAPIIPISIKLRQNLIIRNKPIKTIIKIIITITLSHSLHRVCYLNSVLILQQVFYLLVFLSITFRNEAVQLLNVPNTFIVVFI